MSKRDPFLQRVFDLFQHRLNFLWLREDSLETDEFKGRLKEEAKLSGISKTQAALAYVQRIENKATSLLQHVSMMIALTGIYFVFSDSSLLLRAMLTFEILGYIWAALCCLRCLLEVSSKEWIEVGFEHLNEAYALEGYKRELIYRHAMQLLVFLTICFAFIVLLHSALHLI